MAARMLLFLLLRVQTACTEGSRFEDCEEYLTCLADPPSCIELIIEGPGDTRHLPHNTSLNIIGTIPRAIGNLTALTTLVIAENGVSGTIPETIGLLTMLQTLRLSSDPVLFTEQGLLSGTIPPSIGKLTMVENLCVYQSAISGTIPSTLAEMVSLEYVSIFANKLVGTLPELTKTNKVCQTFNFDRKMTSHSPPHHSLTTLSHTPVSWYGSTLIQTCSLARSLPRSARSQRLSDSLFTTTISAERSVRTPSSC